MASACGAARPNLRASFAGQGFEPPWDPLRRACFTGYVLWLYFTTPFALAAPEVEAIERAPRVVEGRPARVLRATFQQSIATHCATQDFLFGADLMLVRRDRHVNVAGSFAAAQRILAYPEADGLSLPSRRRRAFRAGPDDEPDPNAPIVSVDLSDVTFR